MRKSRMFLIPQFLGSLALLSAVLSMSGCADDPMADAVLPGRTIRFDVSETGGWQSVPQSRAAADTVRNPAPQPSGVLTLQGDTPADTLFLHASVTGGIDGARFVRTKTGTRAAPVTEEAFHDSFGVLASIYDGEWDEESCTPQYMYDVKVTEESGWTTSYLWPGNGWNLRFFAYAPYQCGGVVLSGSDATGTPKITYTVPPAVGDQEDLCVAVADNTSGSENSVASLTFDHVLTAVRFTTGDKVLAGKISKVSLKGVYGKATLAMGSTNWTEYDDSVNEFSQEINVEVDGSEGQEITSGVATFMMLPQTLPDGAKIEIVYTDKQTSTERTLTASIDGFSWPPGTTVTYKISTTSIDVTPTFTVTPLSFTYEGGDSVYTVVSYVSVSDKVSGQETVPVGWEAEFVEGDDANGYIVIQKPDWIYLSMTGSDKGSIEGEVGTATVAKQDGVIDDSHIEALKNAAEKGSKDSPYNLSNASGVADVERTANCYVINAPGTYSLPLVYGNAIDKARNPTPPYYNTSAYTSMASGEHVLGTFLNHTGAEITSPYIYENKDCQPKSAKLIWQDVKGLVSVNPMLDKQSLVFTVNRATIEQGNAVVAVCDDAGQVMWSWHIWVTDYKLGDDLKTVSYSGTYKLLPYNLGWCDGETTNYAARSVKVRFTQKETGEQQVITVSQEAATVSDLGNNPYYQWGRKDPMLPSAGTDNTNKTWYDDSGDSSTELNLTFWSTGNTTLINGIRNPGTFCSNRDMDNLYYNLWAADNATTSADLTTSVKTVYDPCPVGYKVPVIDAFKAFTATGGLETSTSGKIKGTWNTAEKGWDFNCTEGTVFFPALGYRNSLSGSLTNVGSSGEFWSALPSQQTDSYARQFYFLMTMVHPDNAAYRGCGNPVRPVAED